MTEWTNYWTTWAPYWSYEEENFLDLETINKLAPAIINPALIIGAGQGLLVEQLRKKGFKVDGVDLDPNMIMHAKTRRGLNLIQANAKNMPFADKTYKTSIIATGVVDFLDDEEEIRLIMNEAFRVTENSGKVFVAFYKYSPKVEKLLRSIDLITDKGFHRFKRMYELIRLSLDDPIAFIRTIKHDGKLGFFGAFLILIKPLPKKEKTAAKNIAKIWKQACSGLANPELLIRSLPELLPYRSEQDIRNLFKNLNMPIHNMSIFESCVVAQL